MGIFGDEMEGDPETEAIETDYEEGSRHVLATTAGK